MRVLVITAMTRRFRFDNNLIIPRALAARGHDVWLADVDSLEVADGTVYARQARFTGADVGDLHPALDGRGSCEDFDVVWVLALSHPANEVDCLQILWVLARNLPFVNTPESLFFVNNKIALFGLGIHSHLPECWVSSSVEQLRSVARDGRWVLKPTNAGCGAGVVSIESASENFDSLLNSATGNAYQKYEMYTREGYGVADRYAVLQRYVSEMAGAEKRVCVAGGTIIGGYKKTPRAGEFRANIAVGGQIAPLDLSAEEESFVLEVSATLGRLGVNYVGYDLAYPFLVEVNLVNPGGLNHHFRATGEDVSEQAVELALAGALRRFAQA
jgi:glutathione synthase